MAAPSRRRVAPSKEGQTSKAETPEQRRLTGIHAERLAATSGVTVDQVAGKTTDQLLKLAPILFDPSILFRKRVCGRVVRTDPVSGVDWGVPGATVQVWDTDVNLFASFPAGSPYGWFYPWGWRRELIGSAVTDSCGNFCVWIPRFDIDWVLRWRRERHCFFDLLRRVSIADLIERLHPVLEVPPHPWPGPDPDPLAFLREGVGSLNILEQAVGPTISAKLAASAETRFGEVAAANEILEAPAFPRSLPHPDPSRMQDVLAEHGDALPKADLAKLNKLRSDPRAFAASWIGPFLGCYDVFVPEFERIIDVPDISFTVTQDVNGDGAEETIYAEGLFEVRWDAGSIPPVTLRAAPFAFATPVCGDGPNINCAAPELVVVGHMPLKNPIGPGVSPIVDTGSGYAVRPNRPHDSGRPSEVVGAAIAASAPLTGLLEFWGCAHHAAGGANATHYRIQHRVSTDAGATFGPWLPIFDTWNHWRVVGNPSVLEQLPISTTTGWYPVLNSADGWIPGDHYLLQWHGAPDGVIDMQLELGVAAGASFNVIGQAPPVRIVVDNSRPSAAITSLAWRPGTSGPWQPLLLNCPTIRRNNQAIQVKVGIAVSASHLRSFSVSSGGCGASGGPPALVEGLENLETGVPLNTFAAEYWHRDATDNVRADEVTYAVPLSSAAGAYSFGVTAWSRAFSPGGGHVYDPANPDVGYDPQVNYWPASIGVAIVD